MRLGPVAFLLLVPALWAVVRGAMLWPEEPGWVQPAIRWASPLRARETGEQEVAVRPAAIAVRAAPRSRLFVPITTVSLSVPTRIAGSPPPQIALNVPSPAPAPRPVAVAPVVPRNQTSRFSLSAWALARGDTAPGLATAGQLGGSQTGVRARYALAEGVHLVARVSGPLRSRLGKEAAIGLDVRPVAALPVTLLVERRIGLDRGGRDAFGVGAFGGFDRTIAPGWRVDGYAQAGVVGLKRRDAYVDGALRAERALTKEIGVGPGAWGGAQPGAARLDLGPQLVVHAGRFRLGAEWRQRVAGDARPGSGPVVSLGADF